MGLSDIRSIVEAHRGEYERHAIVRMGRRFKMAPLAAKAWGRH
jgi:hypothetical protein